MGCKMDLIFVSANSSFVDQPALYVPSITIEAAAKPLSDKAVIGALCPNAGKFLGNKQGEVIGGHACIDDYCLLTEQDIKDMNEAKDNGFDIEIVHMDDFELENGGMVFDDIEADFYDLCQPQISEVRFSNGAVSIANREQDFNEVRLPLASFDFLSPFDRPLSLTKCKLKLAHDISGREFLLKPMQALNEVSYYGADLVKYVKDVVSQLGGLLEQTDTSEFDASTWYYIQEWRQLSLLMEQVIYELASDFSDVWFSPAQILYMADKLKLDALNELGKELLVSKIVID